jgi:hypothetical protein
MVPPESVSQYLSNEYQCYGVIKLPIFFCILILVTKVDLRPKRVKPDILCLSTAPVSVTN